tara:strand:- start:18433 stop:19263 length:831 start_codon:yes stop_codon:yes gene_type:complete
MKNTIKISWALLIFASSLTSCGDSTEGRSKRINKVKFQPTPILKYSVDAKYPHSSNSFTEGFLVYDNAIFESTGSPSNLPSTVSVYGTVNSSTGQIEIHNQLDTKYFGEGITILNHKVYQLTYKSREGFVYDLESRKKVKSFQIPTKEGWGMTTDGENLIMSDGSSSLYFIDTTNLEKIGTLKVFDKGRPVNYLNELEYVNGFIYANVFTTDWLVKIDIESGKVVAKIDLTDLKLAEDRLSLDAMETNGIAYNHASGKFLVTGKMWQNIYELSLFE